MKKRQRILFITCENPLSKDNGDRIYTSNFIEGLINLNYFVDLVCYDDNKSFNKEDENISGYNNLNISYVKLKRASKLKVMFSILPGSIVNRRSKAFLNLIELLLYQNKYKNIFVNHQRMVFSLEAILKKKLESKIFFISHNVESLLSKNNSLNCKSFIDKILYWQDALKNKMYESKWLNYFDYITTISEYDQDYYKLNFSNPKTFVLRPNFEINKKNINYEKKQINKIIIVGSFIWKPKRENIISFLKSNNFNKLHENNIHLTIVGRAEPILYENINNKYKGVHMTGEVESVDSYYNEAKIAIIPEVLGGGFKLKVAEAALHQCAIFAVKGAITKCNLIKNKHFKESNSFDELIDEIIKAQNNENDLDLMIKRTSRVANYDFSKEKFKIDLKNILNK